MLLWYWYLLLAHGVLIQTICSSQTAAQSTPTIRSLHAAMSQDPFPGEPLIASPRRAGGAGLNGRRRAAQEALLS